jgi:hypothetical protein
MDEKAQAFQAKLALTFDEFARIVQQQIDALSAVGGHEIEVERLLRLKGLAELGANKARMHDHSSATRSASE